jgi:3-oxoacyl-[acyl-carrier protein] reductase/meso-butanediol dehydrogenase/(S,S)-butanediol dehydrogenase/diacetyl reductase
MKRKTVVITGGGRGMGAVLSKRFFDAGYHVVIIARTDSGMAATMGDRGLFIKADLRNISEIKAAFDNAIRWSGKINVLINNAGYSGWRPLEEIDEAFWDDMIDTNLKGLLFSTQAACTSLVNGDSIINISSLAGKRGSANNSVYCAAKFGVNGITQSLAKELGAKGIRVNAVCPVYIRTAGLEEALNEQYSPSNGADLTAFLADFARTQTALGVLPTEEQVASTCLFLASEIAGAITGQCINVDCGVMPQ